MIRKADLTEQRRLLIGSYFLAEYSLESAALFNPSIVPHPDQTGLPPGALRFILSLRPPGKVTSLRSRFAPGSFIPTIRLKYWTLHGFLTEPRQIPNSAYEKDLFCAETP